MKIQMHVDVEINLSTEETIEAVKAGLSEKLALIKEGFTPECKSTKKKPAKKNEK